MRARLERVEVAVERRLARPGSGRVPHDQRRVDGHQAVVADVGLHRGLDAFIVVRGTDVQQPAVGVDDRDTGVVLLAPGQIEPNKVHGPHCA